MSHAELLRNLVNAALASSSSPARSKSPSPSRGGSKGSTSAAGGTAAAGTELEALPVVNPVALAVVGHMRPENFDMLKVCSTLYGLQYSCSALGAGTGLRGLCSLPLSCSHCPLTGLH